MSLLKFYWSKIRNNSLFLDSAWAIGGNGLGNALLLAAGIIIAHLLGKDDYGEYGLVKSTMFFVASFASFGLNYTTTKFVANSLVEKPKSIRSYTDNAVRITILTSCTMAIILAVFSHELANFLNEPELSTPLQILGILIVLRALLSTFTAILSGFGKFKSLAKNNVASGVCMILLAVPLTKYWELSGALACLVISQLLYLFLNWLSTKQCYKHLRAQESTSVRKEMIEISWPVAMHEAVYAIGNWAGAALIAKMSTLGQLGIYSAAAQWNAIILFIPKILVNVIVSNLSKTVNNQREHDKIIRINLIANLICSTIPFLIVLVLSNSIAGLYGPTFIGLGKVISVIVFSTIFSCCSNVFYSEFISNGKTLVVFIGRLIHDVFVLLTAFLLIKYSSQTEAALDYAIGCVVGAVIYLFILWGCYTILVKRKVLSHG